MKINIPEVLETLTEEEVFKLYLDTKTNAQILTGIENNLYEHWNTMRREREIKQGLLRPLVDARKRIKRSGVKQKSATDLLIEKIALALARNKNASINELL